MAGPKTSLSVAIVVAAISLCSWHLLQRSAGCNGNHSCESRDSSEGLNLLQSSSNHKNLKDEEYLAGVRSAARFFNAELVYKELQQPPSSYPDNLKGILWLDQSGVLGDANGLFTSSDLCNTFGGTDFGELDPETRILAINPSGPGWTWWNDAKAYTTWWRDRYITGWHYEFHWNENYTFAEFYGVLKPFGIFPSIRIPKFLLDMTITLQTPDPAKCPPGPNTPKSEVGKCAKWRRETFALSQYNSPKVYYVWEIVDKDNKPVEAYLEPYVKFAHSKQKPMGLLARLLLGSDSNGDSFVANTNFFTA